jgi:hypothetical protein
LNKVARHGPVHVTERDCRRDGDRCELDCSGCVSTAGDRDGHHDIAGVEGRAAQAVLQVREDDLLDLRIGQTARGRLATCFSDGLGERLLGTEESADFPDPNQQRNEHKRHHEDEF